ncbi:MAG: hypothetical protein ISS19_05210 [Bacteroidales bacterium]|nr:hypothetical protein [Bacteroidales bacterium]
MKKFCFLCFLIITLLHGKQVVAQEYDSGIGVRAGLNPGITGKIFMARHSVFKTMGALEGIVAVRFKGVAVTGLYEFHTEVFDTKGLYLYFGGGIHVAYWDSEEVFWETDNSGMQTYAGLDGIIGLEYVVQDFPLTFGMDWKPNLNLIGDNAGIIDDIAVSVRYYFD